MIVVDASAVLEALLRTSAARARLAASPGHHARIELV
jgi:predicted nucleic acid-binding protein